jgi:hypothetical protein
MGDVKSGCTVLSICFFPPDCQKATCLRGREQEIFTRQTCKVVAGGLTGPHGLSLRAISITG